MNEVTMNEAGTLNEIFDALCPPNGSVICPCSSYGLPKITENPRWEDIFVRECGGVPHKAVSGCQPHYPHRHALKDHAEKKKIDEDDDNADESSELHRHLYNYLCQAIPYADQNQQLKRQMKGQTDGYNKKKRELERKAAAETDALQKKVEEGDRKLEESKQCCAELQRGMQQAQDQQQELRTHIAELQRQCEETERAARIQIEEERRKTADSLASFTHDLADSLHDSIRDAELAKQRMERERELQRQREAAAQKAVAEEKLRNAHHEQACLRDALAAKERGIQELKQQQDQRMNAVAHAVREDEKEKAKGLEEECTKLKEQVANKQDEVEELEDRLKPMMLHENILFAKVDALFALAHDALNYSEDLNAAWDAAWKEREAVLRAALPRPPKLPELPETPEFPEETEKAINDIKATSTRKLELVVEAVGSAVRGMPLARVQQMVKGLGIQLATPIGSKEDALKHIDTHLRGTTAHR